MSQTRQSAAVRSLVAVALGGGALALTFAGVQVATAQPVESEEVCPGLDSGKINTTGDPMSITIPNSDTPALPEGALISQYCVKAGSVNQGLGPEIVNFDPGEESVTFEYPVANKAISHYSFAWTFTPEPTESPTPTPTETPTESPTPTPTATSTPPPVETPAATPEATVTPASPETPAPVDSDEVIPDESVPVDIANPGALPIDDEPAPVEPASPEQASVPTSVPAGGGAASSKS